MRRAVKVDVYGTDTAIQKANNIQTKLHFSPLMSCNVYLYVFLSHFLD